MSKIVEEVIKNNNKRKRRCLQEILLDMISITSEIKRLKTADNKLQLRLVEKLTKMDKRAVLILTKNIKNTDTTNRMVNNIIEREMIDLELEKTLIGKALIELDEQLKNSIEGKIELLVIGGFALVIHGIREDLNEYTDIDYIGEEITNDRFTIIKNKIGLKYGLGFNWFNNTVVLPGNTLEDIELLTGKLNFDKLYDLNVFSIYVLRPIDLLRLKVIAIDTMIMAYEKPRDKDLPDIKRLLNYLKIDFKKLKQLSQDYVLCKETFEIIEDYIVKNMSM